MIGLLPSLVVLLIAADAEAPKEKARALVSTGNQLYAKGEYGGALALYQRAYDVHPSAVLLYNIARAHQMSGDPIRAASCYERFLAESGAKPGTERYQLTIEGLRTIDQALGKIVIRGAPEGAETRLDDALIAAEQALRVLPGEHEIAASLPKHLPFRTVASVGPGVTVTVEIALLPEPIAPPIRAASETVVPEERSVAETWWFWTLLAAGAAVAAGVTVAVVVGNGEFERTGELDSSSTGEWVRF